MKFNININNIDIKLTINLDNNCYLIFIDYELNNVTRKVSNKLDIQEEILTYYNYYLSDEQDGAISEKDVFNNFNLSYVLLLTLIDIIKVINDSEIDNILPIKPHQSLIIKDDLSNLQILIPYLLVYQNMDKSSNIYSKILKFIDDWKSLFDMRIDNFSLFFHNQYILVNILNITENNNTNNYDQKLKQLEKENNYLKSKIDKLELKLNSVLDIFK